MLYMADCGLRIDKAAGPRTGRAGGVYVGRASPVLPPFRGMPVKG